MRFCVFLGIVFVLESCRLVGPTRSSGKACILDKKGLTEIPSEVYADQTITTLSLFGNKFSELNDSLAQMQQLEVLYLGKNHFKHFPEVVCQLANLRILSLAYNEIDSIPASIGKLKKLEWLILTNNRIVHLSDSIGGLISLKQLNLQRNELQVLPERLYKLRQLQVLNLSFNQLIQISDSLSQLTQLKELNVYRSGILLSLPETICQLRFLELLKVDPNTVLPTCIYARKTDRLVVQVIDL